jgi:anaerobic dimethyl sulfoxide reductase subunit A
MKRKNWAPGGGKKELRGRDEWVRISWDEALTIVANELIRVKTKYGNASILSSSSSNMRNMFGGAVTVWWTNSGGTWRTTGRLVMGASTGYPECNDRMDHRNIDLFVLWGVNPIWSSGGNPTYNFLASKRMSGAKCICIDPNYNDSLSVIADEWIPIRLGTDHAMLLGMAYTLITEDDPKTNPLIDWDFLNRCAVGFDRDHMPQGADPNENFRDYVLGLDETGKPAPEGHKNYPAKTTQWASEICGVPATRIRSLAIEVAKTKNVGFGASSAPARIFNADSLPQMFMTFGAMTGHMGRSGSFVMGGNYKHTNFGGMADGPALVRAGSSGVPAAAANPLAPPSQVFTVLPIIPGTQLNDNEIPTALLTGKYTAGYKDVRDINIQLIADNAQAATLQTFTGTKKAIEGYRKVEFVYAHAQFLTTKAKYADVVLPVTTEWEKYGTLLTGNREMLIWASQVTPPLFEAKDDIWIEAEIGKRLGLDPTKIDPVPLKQQIFNQIAGAQVMKEDGKTYETLVTITDADIAELGVTGKPQTGKISIKEFKDRGVYQVPRKLGDAYTYIPLKTFRDDPKANPIPTPSGKIEIYCQTLKDKIKSFGWTEVRAIPSYNPPIEGYEATFADWKNKVKGPYPLQLHNTHYGRRSHSVFDNVQQLRRAFPQEFWMNPVDAEARGIKHGDFVLISSQHGQTIRPVCVTTRVMPGTVDLFHGAWADVDEETGIDRAGADNYLGGAIPTGQGTDSYNSCIAQVEKWNGKPLEPDYKWPQRIPIKEA